MIDRYYPATLRWDLRRLNLVVRRAGPVLTMYTTGGEVVCRDVMPGAHARMTSWVYDGKRGPPLRLTYDCPIYFNEW